MSFTPGPWDASPWSSVVGGGVFAQPDKTENMVLLASVRSSRADAQLMAAAPDLLWALMHLRDCIDEGLPFDMDRVDAAIAKAVGR